MNTIMAATGFLTGYIVPFILVLSLLVFVHEMGHYLVGRWCGIRSTAFSIGFGPELIGFTDKRGTRWKLAFGNSARRLCQVLWRRRCGEQVG